MSKQSLRILTYNLHKGFNVGNRHFILPEMRDALRQADADIMLLQEIQGEHSRHQQKHALWPDRPHCEFIAEDMWPHFAYAKNAVYSVGHHGNAILSKYALQSWENINVSPYSWASRSLLHGVIHLPDTQHELHIICLHLGLTGTERKRQLQTLCDRIDEHVPHHAPLVVAGDFNDWNGQAEKHFSEQLNLKEAFRTLHKRHARTWPSWMPIFKMDRIYYRELDPILCERPPRSSWKSLSDHAPLIAAFEF